MHVKKEALAKGISIAILIETKDTSQIKIIFQKELEKQRTYGKALCHFKVSECFQMLCISIWCKFLDM